MQFATIGSAGAYLQHVARKILLSVFLVAALVAVGLLTGCTRNDLRPTPQDQDGDGYDAIAHDGVDCDDTDPDVNPGAPEICGNAIDDNCDGEVDDAGEGGGLYYQDLDRDGYGQTNAFIDLCYQPEGFVPFNGDCNDGDDEVHPAAVDDCDLVDTDCDGRVDEDALGDEEVCAAWSCEDVLYARPGAVDGYYWLDPGTGPFETRCNMSSGGFTLVTGTLIRDWNWASFSATPDDPVSHPYEATWDQNSEANWGFLLRPLGDSNTAWCVTVAVRATVILPWTFDEWYGSWDVEGEAWSSSHDDTMSEDWGHNYTEFTTLDCDGQLIFGTPALPNKKGGEYGADWFSIFGGQTWSWGPEATPTPTNEVRWEVLDHRDTEGVAINNIELWVR